MLNIIYLYVQELQIHSYIYLPYVENIKKEYNKRSMKSS